VVQAGQAGSAGDPVEQPESFAAVSDSGLDFGFEPFLKSVAYQPLPFNWKPAAEINLTYESLPHAGQTATGASFTFCRYSFSKLQDPQRYS
jgi:hypothetical protein